MGTPARLELTSAPGLKVGTRQYRIVEVELVDPVTGCSPQEGCRGPSPPVRRNR
jgi:hypothetical protein